MIKVEDVLNLIEGFIALKSDKAPAFQNKELAPISAKLKEWSTSIYSQLENEKIEDVKYQNQDIYEQQKFYCNILNSMHEGFTIQDKNGKIIHFNESATKILGLTEDQLLGKTSLDPGWQAIKSDGSAFPGIDHPAMQTIKTGLSQLNVMMGIKTPDGKTKWLSVNSVPFTGQYDNQDARVLVTFSDVTKQFQKDKIFEGLVQNSPSMIYQFVLTKDGNSYFPFVSPKAYEIYEITAEEMVDNPKIMPQMIHHEDSEDLQLAIIKSAEHCTPFEWKGRIVTRSGKLKWILAKSIPRKEHEGSVHWDGIVIDITHEVLIEEELAFERVKAMHSAKLASLGEMSAGMAHEINNPLTIILGVSKLLNNSTYEAAKFSKGMVSIEKAVRRIAKIVNDLQRFARVELKSKKANQQIQSIFQEMNTYIEIKSKQDYVDIQIEMLSKAFIHCDALEIEQVMMNLINNAIDAVSDLEEKWIKVKAYDEDSVVVLRVIDSGAGILESGISKIFDPFFTTKEVGKGTGLGLSIAQGIIRNHGGEILVLKDFPNTCFEVRLPISQSNLND